ncbi:MAG: hypothetical protein WEA09_14590 [Gemmatimonadota bacterium]
MDEVFPGVGSMAALREELGDSALEGSRMTPEGGKVDLPGPSGNGALAILVPV